MRRAIVHIGMPRTGSTSFQHVLTRLRPDLAAAGILYPDLTPDSARHAPHLNHQYLGETLDGRRPRAERAELLGALAGSLAQTDADVVILSYESLIQQTPRTPQTLRAVFAAHGFAMEALVVVKPQSEQVNSVYSHRTQFLRERHCLAHFARSYEQSPNLDYDRLVRPWIAACAGRLRAVGLRDRRSTVPLIGRLIDEMGLGPRITTLLRPDDLTLVENRSPGPVAIEVSRRLRARHAHRHAPARDVTRFVEQAARDRGHDATSFRGIGPDLRAHLTARFQSTNDRFARAIWGCPWDDIVTPAADHPPNELAAGPIDPDTESVIGDILSAASERFALPARASILGRALDHAGDVTAALISRR